MKCKLILSTVALLCSSLSALLIAQEQQPELPFVEVANTGLALPKPTGFENSDSFYGFQQQETGASVMVSIIPGPFSEVASGFKKSTLASKGIKLISKQDKTIGNQPGYLLHVSQPAYGQEFQKWIAVFGDAKKTKMVVATYPASKSELLSELLRKVVMAAKPTATAGKVPSLPFTLGNVDGLTRVKSIEAMGRIAAFTKNGKIPASSPSDPIFIAAPSLGAVPVGDPKAFAIKRLNQAATTKIDKVNSISDVKIAQLTGWEIEASGHDKKTDRKLIVYQVMLFPPKGGYILMTGLVGEKESDAYLPKFKSMAKTYQPAPPASK